MKKKTFKEILADGVALLFPLLIALYLFKKLLEEIRKILIPLASKLGLEHFLGRFTLSILALLAIFLLTIFLGLMMEWPVVAKFRNGFESIMLRIFPPLNQLKVLVGGFLRRQDATQYWKSVLLKESENYWFAFLVEETDVMGVFVIMKSDSLHEGHIEMLEKGSYSYTEVDAVRMKQSLRKYGENATDLIRKTS